MLKKKKTSAVQRRAPVSDAVETHVCPVVSAKHKAEFVEHTIDQNKPQKPVLHEILQDW